MLKTKRLTPHYHGKSWLDVRLPREIRDWSHNLDKSITHPGHKKADVIRSLDAINKRNAWKWPKRKHFFFSDLHGDPEAFAASLTASGGIKKTGPSPTDFVLSKTGRDANFVIGGDCFDKGPSTLNLLRTIYYLKTQGARVRVLAGNHDVRVLFGMMSVGEDISLENSHFFIRTGRKIIPLLKEIWDEYLACQKNNMKNIPSKKECFKELYPHPDWFIKFPHLAEGKLPEAQIQRELLRISRKHERFEHQCEKAGMTLRQVYASVMQFRKLFMEEGGEFYWFYKQMRLGYRSGSFLFIHAGIDNHISKRLADEGMHELNRAFKKAIKGQPFDFYYSPLCNTLRTKYRRVDYPFTKKGAHHLGRAGVSALIHGHRNLHNGQRLALRNFVLNFECDTSLDQDTRQKEGVKGRGASVTIIDPIGQIYGISSDFPYIKLFDPVETVKKLSRPHPKKKRANP